jgi:hypothetical protein
VEKYKPYIYFMKKKRPLKRLLRLGRRVKALAFIFLAPGVKKDPLKSF